MSWLAAANPIIKKYTQDKNKHLNSAGRPPSPVNWDIFPPGTGFPGGPRIPGDPRGPIAQPPEKVINWGEVLKAGKSADYFGHADYNEALSRGASRQQILRYLDANPGVLRAQNVKGGGGLYDQIRKEGADAIGTHYGDKTQEGTNQFFGAADYAGSRAAGATDLQIQNWLQANPDTLRGGNTFESLKAGYGGGNYGAGTQGTYGQSWQPFNTDQMNQYQRDWEKSMSDYNTQMQDWFTKMEERRNQVRHTGTKDVEQGRVTSVAQAPGTYAGGGGGTANWGRPRRPKHMINQIAKTIASTGLNIR